jgi:rhodanese-related sulfurtransferase
VEALGAAFYGDAHLPGAINISPAQVDRLAEQLIPDRDSPVVVYCRSSCSSAETVAGRLEAVGYTDVAVYIGGKEDWVEHGLPVEHSDAFDSEDNPTAADELQ